MTYLLSFGIPLTAFVILPLAILTYWSGRGAEFFLTAGFWGATLGGALPWLFAAPLFALAADRFKWQGDGITLMIVSSFFLAVLCAVISGGVALFAPDRSGWHSFRHFTLRSAVACAAVYAIFVVANRLKA